MTSYSVCLFLLGKYRPFEFEFCLFDFFFDLSYYISPKYTEGLAYANHVDPDQTLHSAETEQGLPLTVGY